MMDATELEVTGRDKARIAVANGFMNHGEAVARLRDGRGRVAAIHFAGARLLSEAALRREVIQRYEK
jgi:D-alanyl-D-alanine carboxypeptidase